MHQAQPSLITVAEAARRLSLSQCHTRRLIGASVLPSVRVGRAVRIPETAVSQFITERTTPKKEPQHGEDRPARAGGF